MNAYRNLELVAASPLQKWAVMAYFLFEEPVACDAYRVADDAQPCMAVGMWLFAQAFPTHEEAMQHARRLLENAKVRQIVVRPACMWRPLTTHVTTDDTQHSPLLTEKHLMRQQRSDGAAFDPRYQLRKGLTTAKKLQSRVQTPHTVFSSAMHELVTLDDESEQLRQLLADNRLKAMRNRASLSKSRAEVDDWVRNEESATENVVPRPEWVRMEAEARALQQGDPPVQESAVASTETLTEFLALEPTETHTKTPEHHETADEPAAKRAKAE